MRDWRVPVRLFPAICAKVTRGGFEVNAYEQFN